MITVGSIAMVQLEGNWTLVDRIYWSVVTLTTVGYGDFTPSNDVSKLFCSVYMLVSTAAGANALGSLSEIFLLFQRRVPEKNDKDD